MSEPARSRLTPLCIVSGVARAFFAPALSPLLRLPSGRRAWRRPGGRLRAAFITLTPNLSPARGTEE